MTESTNSAPSTPPTTDKKVSFNSVVTCIDTIHISDYTYGEVLSTWFTSKEYEAIRKENKRTISRMDRNIKFMEGDDFSRRGLEGHVANPIIRRPEHRYFSIDAVLNEQRRRREEEEDREGINDGTNSIDTTSVTMADHLAEIYTEYSFTSNIEAHIMGVKDEKTVLGFEQQQPEEEEGEVEAMSCENKTSKSSFLQSSINHKSNHHRFSSRKSQNKNYTHRFLSRRRQSPTSAPGGFQFKMPRSFFDFETTSY